MGDYGFIFLFLFSIMFWIPGIIIFIYKYNFKKNAEVVLGEITSITPVYKGVLYTVSVDYDTIKEESTLRPNSAFSKYMIGDTIEVYRAIQNGKVVHKFIDGYYTIVYAMTLPALAFYLIILLGGA